MAEENKNKKLLDRLKNKYRLVIMNDDTFEEKVSLKLSPMNVFVFAGTIILTLVTGMIYLIAFTPLREYVPGYAADINNQGSMITMNIKADSLEKAMKAKDDYIKNIRNVLNGNVGNDTFQSKSNVAPIRFDTIKSLTKTKEDSQLRSQFESDASYDLAIGDNNNKINSISGFFFFPPLKGTVTNTFDPVGQHFGIDIVAPKNEAVKSTLDGTVIFSSWTVETGYVIGIQHSNNLISVYKHNATLLKKTGNNVKAGEAIAIVGDSGEMTTGPHLHFELWYNGVAIDPTEYVALK
jgi:murein DD-endopeptidase MepM/ murein hydrolase activator NlpD